MSSVYYNEIDAGAAAWVLELIKAGHLPDGEVDTRSIADVSAADLRGFTQCHFFAGIGGWPYALELAGWDGPVWTGSCPCQPFSSVGANAGTADARHLWPHWFRLISQCQPAVIFGEQVASSAALAWLDTVYHDLESKDYAVAAADIAAASVGAPHIRQRLYFVGVADSGRQQARCEARSSNGHGRPAVAATFWDCCQWLECSDGRQRPAESGIQPLAYGISARVGRLRGYGNAIVPQVAAQFIGAFMERQ